MTTFWLQNKDRVTLETPRLQVMALLPEELRQWKEDLPGLETALELRYAGQPLEGFFGGIVAGQAQAAANHRENYLWHTFWLLLRREDRVVVGQADFKAPPDAKGQVEIGYGLGREFEGNGYMTEAVAALCSWALEQPGVGAVIASTDVDGLASQRVLSRCGFRQTRQGELLWWKLDRNPLSQGGK